MGDEYKANELAMDRKITTTSIGYDDLMKNGDGSSEDTQFSQLADDEFEIKGDDEEKEDTIATAKAERVSIVVDDDMISLMSAGSLSDKQREGMFIKTQRQSNVFAVIHEED